MDGFQPPRERGLVKSSYPSLCDETVPRAIKPGIGPLLSSLGALNSGEDAFQCRNAARRPRDLGGDTDRAALQLGSLEPLRFLAFDVALLG